MDSQRVDRMSGWAQFRKQWIKPEVYPLIGSMVFAIGVCGASLANKISQPTLTFSKSARKGGIFTQFEGVDEVTPGMATWSKSKSHSIFDSSYEILENKKEHWEVPKIEVIVEEVEEAAEEAIAAIEEAVSDVIEDAGEVVAAVKEAVEEKVEAIEDKIEDKILDIAVDRAEEKLLEKGAELVAELKSVA